MSKHIKTLADVQPGGPVRLPDQDERTRFEAWVDSSTCLSLRVIDGSRVYASATTEAAWGAWQQATAIAALDARALGETIDQRDRCEEVADELAAHIASITGVDIGEHSSANCRWQNAIEAAEEYKPAQATAPGLWAMHLAGPDDLHPAPSKAHALEAANAINCEFATRLFKPYAVVVPWTGRPDDHANGLSDWANQWGAIKIDSQAAGK